MFIEPDSIALNLNPLILVSLRNSVFSKRNLLFEDLKLADTETA